MTAGGSKRYRELSGTSGDSPQLPPKVRDAVAAAEELYFEFCVHPATGRLLQTLAGGVPRGGLVGETGTGTGVGLAWMVSMAAPDVSFVSVEIDGERALAAQQLFADMPNVTVLHADAGAVFEHGPFDLLVHDGGWGTGKTGDQQVEPELVLNEGGLMTIDDYTPMTSWPPMFQGEPDHSRIHWLTHPALLATEIRVAADMAVIVGRRCTR